jgi:CheY-like chemotaxis protein
MPLTDVILLVTDIPDHAASYEQALRRRGFSVRQVSRGADALALATSTPPDLIVIDVRLPDIDGWQLCRDIKQHPATGNPPVIMLTDDATKECAEHSSHSGCNAWLARPTRAEDIVRVVYQVLALDSSAPPSPAQAVLGVAECPACAADQIRATLRVQFIQYYCCRKCGLCWRVDSQPQPL